jgi:hypothetical protein
MFQSSPSPKTRCNLRCVSWRYLKTKIHCSNPHLARRLGATAWQQIRAIGRKFQSSPSPKTRCNGSLILLQAFDVSLFQSSPSPKTRCNTTILQLEGDPAKRFQSSPSPKTRCNGNYTKPRGSKDCRGQLRGSGLA